MVLRFLVGSEAVQGDLKQFYASIKLQPEQWNLQRVLMQPDLNPDGELTEAVINSQIGGIKCVLHLSKKHNKSLSWTSGHLFGHF